jgi:pyridinium-3,5-biscarboxylic acid mononucleotide sulfurtransferase
MHRSDKLEDLKALIGNRDRLLISFSGGVDSSLLAYVAKDVLGEKALCVILDSETLPRSELNHAEVLAKSLGLNYQVVRFSILADKDFANNSPKRCYICKKISIGMLKNLAAQCGMDSIADGVNLTDYKDYRPGMAACEEEGIWHPFVDAKISKEDIREIARDLGLSIWDKPSTACLASRIPYGEEITVENLSRVENAEDHLKSLGFGQVRVRDHMQMARIELPSKDMKRALKLGDEIAQKLRNIGYRYVTLDLQGFRSGSMNEVLWTGKK